MGAGIPKHLMQHAFTTGEMSPATLGRQDVSKYLSGAQILENFQVSPQGAIFNDTGTVFVNSAKFSNSKARLIPFIFSNSQAYEVELGNLYARFYIDDGQIQSPPGTPVEVVTPYLASEVGAIQFCQSADYLYLVHPNHPPAAITRTSNTSWNYVVLPFEDGPYQDDNLNPTETLTASALTGSTTITANFAAFQPGNVGAFIRLEEAVTTVYDQWTSGVCYQQGDVVTNAGMVYQNSSNPPPPAWSVSTTYAANSVVSNAGNIYYSSAGGTGGSAPTHTSGTVGIWLYVITITNLAQYPLGMWQSGVTYPVGYPVYWDQNVYVSAYAGGGVTSPAPPETTSTSTAYVDPGGFVWIFVGKKSGIRAPVQVAGSQNDGNLNWTYLHSGFGYVKITAYTDAEHVTATVISNQLPNSVTGGTLKFRLGAWDTYNGYPGAICFYEQRLCFGGSMNFPETIWMSCTDDYYNFAPTTTGTNVLDTNAINITLASGTLNQIVWMLPATRLLVGTVGSEWQIWQANTSSGFSPSNIQAKQMSSLGSAPIQPRLINQSILYCHRSQKRFYEATYNYLYDLYVSKDMNLLADHILREGGGVVDTALQLDPFPTLWVLRADGQLIGLTYLNDEQITAWHRHVYQGTVESISCIPNPANNSDQLWMIVNRTINGETVRYIETMQSPFYPANAQDKSSMWYVECGLAYSGSFPVSTISGLGYLQGCTIVPVVDGAVQPTQVVPSGGTITLQTAANSQVIIGLPYESTMTIMPLDFEGQKGTMQGQTKRVHRIRLRLLNSLGCTAYSNDNPTGAASVESFRATNSNLTQSPPLFTGDHPIILAQGPSSDGVFTIKQTQPYPLNILGIIAELEGYES